MFINSFKIQFKPLRIVPHTNTNTQLCSVGTRDDTFGRSIRVNLTVESGRNTKTSASLSSFRDFARAIFFANDDLISALSRNENGVLNAEGSGILYGREFTPFPRLY